MATKKAAAKKATTKATTKTTRKSTAKKAPPAKKAAPAKKTVPAKAKTPAKKTVAVKAKAPAKKAVAVKAKAPAKKAIAIKAKAPAKKTVVKKAAPTTPVKKVTAKKAAPAKATPKTVAPKATPITRPRPVVTEAAPETPAPRKQISQKERKAALKKLPPNIFSPATGTATSDPFSARELEKFRELIQEIRIENVSEFEELTEQLREMTSREAADDNSYSLHMAEQGTDAMEREKTFLQAQRANDYIKRLDESLRRINDKTFGICRVCGLRLDSKRLMAVPVTQVCTVYKNTNKPCEPGKLHLGALGVKEGELGR